MRKLINILENINEYAGRGVSWFTVVLVILICMDVVMRYLFQTTFIWMIELEKWLFAFIFLIGAGYAFKHDKHVRVDVFYAKGSPKRQAWINLIGGLLFLVPWCVIVIQVAYYYAAISFQMNETSSQVGGLPALYILKFSIFIGFVLLFLQALVSILKSLLVITGKAEASEI